jgi:hypothetical protein
VGPRPGSSWWWGRGNWTQSRRGAVRRWILWLFFICTDLIGEHSIGSPNVQTLCADWIPTLVGWCLRAKKTGTPRTPGGHLGVSHYTEGPWHSLTARRRLGRRITAVGCISGGRWAAHAQRFVVTAQRRDCAFTRVRASISTQIAPREAAASSSVARHSLFCHRRAHAQVIALLSPDPSTSSLPSSPPSFSYSPSSSPPLFQIRYPLSGSRPVDGGV